MSRADSNSTRVLIAALLLLGGCATAREKDEPGEPAAAVVVEESLPWEKAIAPDDLTRLQGLSSAWTEALVDVRRRAGDVRQVRAEGPLLDPEAALPRPAPTPGSYKCRMIKLGTRERRGPAFAAYKPFFCYVGVEGDLLAITKQTGSQRPGGYLYDDRDKSRLVFLGSVALGEEETPPAYGERQARDMAGVFERVGPFRFRLVVPWPRSDSKLDVLELVPAPVQPED